MREITCREAIREALREEMRRDSSVYLMGEDIGVFGGASKVTEGLIDEFGPERIRDTPISEATIVGAGLGSALAGMRPIVEIMYMDFITCGMDQIANQVSKVRYMSGGQVRVPLVLRTTAGSGRSAAAQHSQSLEAWLMHTPGWLVVMPSTPYDSKGLLKASIREDNPVAFIEHKFMYEDRGVVPEEEYTIPLGRGEIKRKGEDVTIVAIGRMVTRSLEAAERLTDQGIDAEVVDPRSLVPLDTELIVNSVKKTGRLLVVQESCVRCGFAAEVAALVAKEAFDYLDAPIERLGVPNIPIPFAPAMERFAIPDVEAIVRNVEGML